METVFSVRGAIDTGRPKQSLDDLMKAGIRRFMLDFGIFANAESMEDEKFRADMVRKHYKNLIGEMNAKGLEISIAKVPILSLYTKRTDLNGRIMQINIACIRACEDIGCKNIIIQPLFSGIERGKEWEENREFYLSLAEQCKNKDTKILLTNQCRNNGGHLVRSICSDGIIAAKWVDSLNRLFGMERFGFCMDVGNCNLCGQDMQSMAVALGERIKAVILTENNGQSVSYMLPFTNVYCGQSTTDWLGLIRGLRQCGFDGHLILDMSDTVSSFSPLLRPPLLQLAKSVMGYFAKQVGIENALKKYKSIVLFGAGNMCRNYMKCYGNEYPPLFTCDNNRKLWGTRFCELEVKNPEELKYLPEGCGILICNIYYREIETQLRNMGIENIEYFNDEYMPSFYFDRLEREND